jgi:hypothetical protein
MRTVRIGRLVSGILLALSLPAAARASLPFIEDDYGKAIAQARAHGLPLFVEAWAPW